MKISTKAKFLAVTSAVIIGAYGFSKVQQAVYNLTTDSSNIGKTYTLDGYKEYMEKEKSKPTATEEFNKNYRKWVNTPNNGGSPYYNEEGENPVYNGMLEETQERPTGEGSPFYDKNGNKVVEDNMKQEALERYGE